MAHWCTTRRSCYGGAAHVEGNPVPPPGVLRISVVSTEPPEVHDILLADHWLTLGEKGSCLDL
eukprot:1653976-Amphidinium_carterae.1